MFSMDVVVEPVLIQYPELLLTHYDLISCLYSGIGAKCNTDLVS